MQNTYKAIWGYNLDAITLNISKVMTKKPVPNIKKRVLRRFSQQNYVSMQRLGTKLIWLMQN